MSDHDVESRLRRDAAHLAEQPLPAELRQRLLAIPAGRQHAGVQRRRGEVAFALATAVALAVVLVVALAGRHASPQSSPAGGRWHESVRVQINGGPGGALGARAGSAWMTARGHTRLYRVDAGSGLVTLASKPDALLNSGGLPSADSAVLVTDDSIWMSTSNRLLRIDRLSGAVLAALPLSGVATPHALISDGTSIWAASGDTGAVDRIDPASGRVLATIPVRSSAPRADELLDPAGLAALDGRILAGAGDGSSITVIDPNTNQVTRSFLLPHPAADILAADGSLWVASTSAGVVDRIDASTGRVVASINVERPVGLAAQGSAVWVGSGNAAVRIDSGSNRVTDRVDVGGAVFALAGDGDSVWVASGVEPYLSRITRGG